MCIQIGFARDRGVCAFFLNGARCSVYAIGMAKFRHYQGSNPHNGNCCTRSPFRPNPTGLSVVELKKVNGTSLGLAVGDFLDGTPVLDIKPDIPYADTIPRRGSPLF